MLLVINHYCELNCYHKLPRKIKNKIINIMQFIIINKLRRTILNSPTNV